MLRLFIVGTFLALLAACQEAPAQKADVTRPVLVATAKFEPMSAERSFVATIKPRIESDLGFRVPGKVASRAVNVGDSVKAGQPLATLDETDLRLQREQSEAEIGAASAALVHAEAELKRIMTLRNEGWSTAAVLDRQKAATEEARGRVTRAERAVSLAKNAHSYATLMSDADGVVTLTEIEPGQVVAAGQSAIRIARLSEKEAVIAVPEAQIASVRSGSASVSLWSDPGSRYPAKLRELSPSADSTTRTYLARFSLPSAEERVQLGMTATVTVGDETAARVVRLPLSALYNQGNGPAVWVIDVDGRPKLRPVEVAAYEARSVLVARGLREGETVVTLGVQKLDEGQRVRVVEALRF